MDKPDICFLQYDLRGDGAERKVCTLANYFVSRGKTVDIGLFGKNTVAYAVDPRVNVTYIRRDSFEYRNEVAHPGYYSVELLNGIRAEATATTRTSLERYTFPGGEGNILLISARGTIIPCRSGGISGIAPADPCSSA